MIKRIIATALGVLSVSAYGVDSTPLKCQLNDTTDQFWFYKEQLIYSSNQFVVFQNFKGRVVTQVDLKPMSSFAAPIWVTAMSPSIKFCSATVIKRRIP